MKLATASDYDFYHQHVDSAYGLQFIDRVIRELEFHSVLDFGCGPGHCVRRFLEAGKLAVGVDVSKVAIDHCPETCVLISEGRRLDWPDRSFDLVFASDVLEHLPEDQAVAMVADLERLTRRWLVASICFRPSECLPELQWHATIQPREWWEARFRLSRVAGWDSVTEPNLFVRRR